MPLTRFSPGQRPNLSGSFLSVPPMVWRRAPFRGAQGKTVLVVPTTYGLCIRHRFSTNVHPLANISSCHHHTAAFLFATASPLDDAQKWTSGLARHHHVPRTRHERLCVAPLMGFRPRTILDSLDSRAMPQCQQRKIVLMCPCLPTKVLSPKSP